MTFVLQTLRAWMNEGPLPSSSGQIIERGLAEDILESNRAQAKGDGLVLKSGRFDHRSGNRHQHAAHPPPNEAMSRSARVLLRYEAGRKAIRAAQALAGSINQNTLPGANIDAIPWEYRAYGDGCHFGGLGLTWHAKALADAWFEA